MKFQVTASRKRPQTLGELVGQPFVSATLGAMIQKGNPAPAYLLSGPRGTGKTSAARILARSLNCEKGSTTEPCGTCSSCREITEGNSPNVIEIDGASNTSVNDVRVIREEILYAPPSAAKKIYIIDEVHMLSNSAFNALLKTIEEPPPYIVFVFATTEIHKVPATICSRCQKFRFRLLSPEIIRDKLEEATKEMNRDFENNALLWIAREAEGSLRDAYTLLDQILSFSNEKITLSDIQEKMGLVGLENITKLVESAAEGDRKKALGLLEEILESGTSVEQTVVETAGFLRDLTLIAHGIDSESLLGLSLGRFPRKPLEAWNTNKLEIAVEDVLNLYRDIRYSLSPRFELELFVERLCALSSRLSEAEILKEIKALKANLNGEDATEAPRFKIPQNPPSNPNPVQPSPTSPPQVGVPIYSLADKTIKSSPTPPPRVEVPIDDSASPANSASPRVEVPMNQSDAGNSSEGEQPSTLKMVQQVFRGQIIESPPNDGELGKTL